MLLKTIVSLIECDLLTGEHHLDKEYHNAFGSDLMSDVLAFVEEDTILITGLVNNQVIRTADMLDLDAIIFVRGKRPCEDIIQMAREHNIALLATKHTMYTAAGVLYSNGLMGLMNNG